MIYIATPCTRPAEWEHVNCLLHTEKVPGMFWDYEQGKPVDLARNILTARFLARKESEYILYIDSDATWDVGAVKRLLSRELPAVSGIIYRRSLPPTPTMGSYLGKDENGHHNYGMGDMLKAVLEHAQRHSLTEETGNLLTLPRTDTDLVEIDGTGAHFFMVHRSVIEAIEPPWFKQPYNGYGGEDFYFCRQIRAAGFQIYADLSVHTGHIVGPGFDYGIREFLAFYNRTDQIQPALEYWDMGPQ